MCNFKNILLILLLSHSRKEGQAVVRNGFSLPFFALKSEAAFNITYLTNDTRSGSKKVCFGVLTMRE